MKNPLLLGVITLTLCAPLAGEVVINEILADPTGSDQGFEWVELFNSGPAAVDVGSWGIERTTSSASWSLRYVVPLSTVIAPGDFLVIGEEFVVGADLHLGQDVHFGFGNAATVGEGVRILDEMVVVVDTVIYGPNNDDAYFDDTGVVATSLAPIGLEGQSMARTTDGVDTNASGVDFSVADPPTLGKSNSGLDPIFSDGFETGDTDGWSLVVGASG